jgi:hypothetical protein
MTKSLKDILKTKDKRLEGVKSNEVTIGSLGKDPGVDYDPKAGDERKWVKLHSTEKHADRVGNDEKTYNASNIEYSMDDPKMNKFGHKKGQDEKVYEEIVDESSAKQINDRMNSFMASQKAEKEGDKRGQYNHLADYHDKYSKASGISKSDVEHHRSMADKYRKAALAFGESVENNKKTLKEVITKRTSAGEIIKDFQKSKNPKFAGKSPEERKRMALGAYYSKHPEKSKVSEDLAMPLLGSVDIPKGKADDTQDEISMVKAELKAIANKAMHILMSMPQDMHVEPWVQSKIAQAKEMINSVHDHMVYGDHDKEENEDAPSDTPMTFPGMNIDASGMNV